MAVSHAAPRAVESRRMPPASWTVASSAWLAPATERERLVAAARFFVRLAGVCLAYYVAGRLGQATTNIRSSSVGPVWPAYGVAVAAFLGYGYQIWPGVALAAFAVAFEGGVPAAAAIGQTAGATLAAATATFLLRRVDGFDLSLSRLRGAIAFVTIGAFGSALVSASIGLSSLYAIHMQPYSGLGSAWLIYWLGDATGVLLVTPLVFSIGDLLAIRSRQRATELAALLALLVLGCIVVFADLPLIPIRLGVLAFAVLPFVMWGAISFGVAGSALSVFCIATLATLLTAFGLGPFAVSTPFVNAVLLDVLFVVLAVSGLALAAVIAERERAESERERLVRERATLESRLRLATIVESTDDAILSNGVDGILHGWNAAAERMFGFTAAEAVGRRADLIVPAELHAGQAAMLDRLRAGERIEHFETVLVAKTGKPVNVFVTVSPLMDADRQVVGASMIIRDITEQKRAAAAKRALVDGQEQERARIAAELHDDIGQRLALLMIEMTMLANDGGTSRALRDQTIELRNDVSAIASDVQSISHQLHSSRLDLLGTSAAVRAFCREFERLEKATVHADIADLPPCPSHISLCLFRVLQEALHNSAKHSGVREFAVRLWHQDGDAHLVVKDHGIGFDAASPRVGHGLGLYSLDERIRLVEGELLIESRPKEGTTVHARVPLDKSVIAPLGPPS